MANWYDVLTENATPAESLKRGYQQPGEPPPDISFEEWFNRPREEVLTNVPKSPWEMYEKLGLPGGKALAGHPQTPTDIAMDIVPWLIPALSKAPSIERSLSTLAEKMPPFPRLGQEGFIVKPWGGQAKWGTTGIGRIKEATVQAEKLSPLTEQYTKDMPFWLMDIAPQGEKETLMEASGQMARAWYRPAWDRKSEFVRRFIGGLDPKDDIFHVLHESAHIGARQGNEPLRALTQKIREVLPDDLIKNIYKGSATYSKYPPQELAEEVAANTYAHFLTGRNGEFEIPQSILNSPEIKKLVQYISKNPAATMQDLIQKFPKLYGPDFRLITQADVGIPRAYSKKEIAESRLEGIRQPLQKPTGPGKMTSRQGGGARWEDLPTDERATGTYVKVGDTHYNYMQPESYAGVGPEAKQTLLQMKAAETARRKAGGKFSQSTTKPKTQLEKYLMPETPEDTINEMAKLKELHTQLDWRYQDLDTINLARQTGQPVPNNPMFVGEVNTPQARQRFYNNLNRLMENPYIPKADKVAASKWLKRAVKFDDPESTRWLELAAEELHGGVRDGLKIMSSRGMDKWGSAFEGAYKNWRSTRLSKGDITDIIMEGNISIPKK